MFCKECAMCTGENVDQSNCVLLPRDIMCLPIGSQLLRSKILWMKHMVFWREPDGEKFYVIATTLGKASTCARRCWSSRFCHSDWKSGLFPDFYRKYSKVRTFPGPGGQQLKIRTFPGNKDPWEPCNKLSTDINVCFDVFFDMHLNKRLSKQSWGWWFETPSRPLWCHCNELTKLQLLCFLLHPILCCICLCYCIAWIEKIEFSTWMFA